MTLGMHLEAASPYAQLVAARRLKRDRARHINRQPELSRSCSCDPAPRVGQDLPREGKPQPLVSREHLKNQLLKALPDTGLQRLQRDLQWVYLPAGMVLSESGDADEHVYFPTTSVVSIFSVLLNGDCVEMAVVGNEGMVGVSVFMGGGAAPRRAVVQSAGVAYRLPAGALLEEFNMAGPAQQLLLRYTQALITQTTQTAACTRHHTLLQKLCRCLLSSLDRLPGRHDLLITQELLGRMLGVRRESITEGAAKLQNEGLIRYTRGRITVTDRPGMERRVCECYAVVKNEYERLLPCKLAA